MADEKKEVKKIEADRVVTLSDGQEVRCVAVSPLLIQEVTLRHPDPDPPVKTITNAAGMQETWVDDDDKSYLRELEKSQTKQRTSSTNAMLLMGLPDVEAPEGNWAENLEALGIEVSDSGPMRRLAYIKFVLLRGASDLTLVVNALTELSGATEEMIERAEADFE